MPDSAPSRNTDRIEQALKHINDGFAVVSAWSTTPDGTCKCVKGSACPSPGKHPIPRGGFLAASTDPKVVRTMLEAGSEPNYGLVAPEGSDIVTFDVDGADWKAKIGSLKAQLGPLPRTKTTHTPSGGLHLFYRWPKSVPIPDRGDELHGFIVRYPWKGIVIGPGSQINGKVYADAGIDQIADLPVPWTGAGTATPLIVIEGGTGYELPDRIPTGHRHAEITRFVASRWNRGISKGEIESSVRSILVPLMDETPSEAKLRHDIDEAWDTAAKKWVSPAGTPQSTSGSTVETESSSDHTGRGVIEVGLLDAPVSVVPLEMRSEAFTSAPTLIALMQHWRSRTDASYESLLVQTLVTAGALMGHQPSCFYGSREQHANVFATLVGTTAAARKGTSADLVRGVWRQVTDAVNGLTHSANSGEGVIALASKRNGDPVLIYEEEFARFLIAKGRDGGTLSPILRQAFDDVPLSSVTATRNVRADVHHIAMIAHVTREDITESFGAVDIKNGFANRIAWIGTFPRTGHPVTDHDNSLGNSLRDDLRAMLAWVAAIPTPLIGGTTHQIEPGARALLADASTIYNDGVGLAPFLSRRLDTIAARLALIYACFDQSRVIEPGHVEAALAVTDYARDTARWVFPETTGDADADLVLRHLQVAGFLNGQELEALVGKRPRDKQRVADMLGLMGYARIAERPRKDGKAGRPQRGLELL